MKISWFSHIKDPKDQKNFKEYVKASYSVLERLSQMLEQKKSNVEVCKAEDYNSPSWAYAAADRNGYVRALNEVIQILMEGMTDDHPSKPRR